MWSVGCGLRVHRRAISTWRHNLIPAAFRRTATGARETHLLVVKTRAAKEQEACNSPDVLVLAAHRGNTLLAHGQLKIGMGESIRARDSSWEGLDAAQAEFVEADELLVQAG